MYVRFELERERELFNVFIELFIKVLLGIFSLFAKEVDAENKLSDTLLSFNIGALVSVSLF
jgi:hypothetical protein